eukprot:m.24974 g.24974  ORF g.24974 m.24974 type:complete len:738 (-) comp4198_c0_seq1:185-2398(-)
MLSSSSVTHDTHSAGTLPTPALASTAPPRTTATADPDPPTTELTTVDAGGARQHSPHHNRSLHDDDDSMGTDTPTAVAGGASDVEGPAADPRAPPRVHGAVREQEEEDLWVVQEVLPEAHTTTGVDVNMNSATTPTNRDPLDVAVSPPADVFHPDLAVSPTVHGEGNARNSEGHDGTEASTGSGSVNSVLQGDEDNGGGGGAAAAAATAVSPDTSGDFKSPPGASSRKRPAAALDDSDDDDESITCPVCFEPWSTSGRHRVVSLKCGHLFGKLCIEKWLKGQGERCPQCNLKATKKDIRPLFVKVLRAVDTSTEESLRRELADAVQETKRAVRAEAAARIQLQVLKAANDRLKAELQGRWSGGGAAGAHAGGGEGLSTDGAGPAASSNDAADPLAADPRFVLDTTVQLKQTGCRVLEYDERHAMLLCSGEGAANPFARGTACGLVKVSTLDTSRHEYIGVHHKAIRDIRTCPDSSGTVLTASLDKTAKLTSINSNAVVCTFQLDAPSWTCCWDHDRPSTFYVGLTTSHIVEFDTRNASEPVRTIRSPTPMPLVALHHLNAADGWDLRGLLACTLGGTAFWDYSDPTGPTYHAIPALDGKATWTAPHAESQHCITTLRPGQHHPRVKHVVSKLSPSAAEGVSCAIQGVMTGGTVQKALSRSTLLSRPETPDSLLLAASDEPTQTVKLWDVASGAMLQSLSCQGSTCTDVKTFQVGRRANVLAVLTDRRLLLHTWRPPS